MAFNGIQGVPARGVRKVNEHTVQEGRALIITEENEDFYSWEDIPNGSLKVSGTTGLIMVKIAGQSNWIPSNIKLDIARDPLGNILDINGNVVTDPAYLSLLETAISQTGSTISIAKDAIIVRENFTIIDANVSKEQFSYEDEDGNRYFGKKSEQGFWFELKKGHYPPGRNMLDVIIDDCLYRAAASGGVIEVSETRFIIPEELINGMELSVKYYQMNRIGNPYPRIYLRKGGYSVSADGYDELTGEDDIYQPEGAEVGDIWFDYSSEPDENDNYLGEDENDNFDGNNFSGTLPGTVADAIAKGIMIDAVAKGHRHEISDITGLDLAMHDAIGSVDTAVNASHANSADTALTANNAQLLQGKTVGVNANNIVAVQYDGKIADSLISDRVRSITNMKDYGSFMDTVHSAIQSYFVKGMIIAWYGEKNKVPVGWAICDGTNNTPDLRNKFIMGVGRNELYSEVQAGLPNITGNFGGNSRPCAPDGAFYHVNYGSQGSNTASDGEIIGFNASYSNSIYGKSDTVQPPAIAMYYIMKK